MASGIFCIENWSGRLAARQSVKPLLDFLERDQSGDGARVIHQPVMTREELRYYLWRFSRLPKYQVGYLALEGNPGGVFVGSDRLSLEDLVKGPTTGGARAIGGQPADWALDLSKKVLVLGSCETLRVSDARIRQFREATRAIAVCGYTRSVSWFDSGGFEVILLSALARATANKDPHRGVKACMEKLRQDAGDLLDKLGFRSDPPWDAPGGQ